MRRIAVGLGVAAVVVAVSLVEGQAPPVERTVLLQEDLDIPGYQVVLLEATIPVGGREGRHSHPGAFVAYVLEGSLELYHEGHPTVTYEPGASVLIAAGTVHEGINRGDEPVKALATLIVEKDVPLTTPAP